VVVERKIVLFCIDLSFFPIYFFSIAFSSQFNVFFFVGKWENLRAGCENLSLVCFSALRDRRFPPIQAREIPYLECTVSLLTDYESATSYLDWEIGKHGMILEFTDPESVRRSATYLPEIAAQEGWTKIETVDSLVRKAGYMGPLTESMRCKFRITRYQSSLCTMHYSEYAAYVKHIRGSAPLLTVKCWWQFRFI
jgi:uncharacterized protein (TIGR00296 family)